MRTCCLVLALASGCNTLIGIEDVEPLETDGGDPGSDGSLADGGEAFDAAADAEVPLMEIGWPELFPNNVTYPGDTLALWQLEVANDLTVHGFGIESQAAGANVYLALYDDSGNDKPVGPPKAFVNLQLSVGSNTSTDTLPASISAGETYWLGFLADDTVMLRESDDAADSVEHCTTDRAYNDGLPDVQSSDCLGNFPVNLILLVSDP